MGRNKGLKHLIAKYDKNKAAKVGIGSCVEDWDESDEWDDFDGLRDEDFGYYPGEGD